MKTKFSHRFAYRLCLLLLASTAFLEASDNLVILDETGVKNLRIETQTVEEGDFEESIFALGRIEVFPGNRAVISSRIPGRVLNVGIRQGHEIQEGEVALSVESRQPGSPPPVIELRAPISGIVSTVHVSPGEPVEPDRILAEILNLREVYALARVPEHLAGQLQPGLPARITIPAVPDAVFEARLEHLGATADPESGTLEAAFHIQDAKERLRPGMRAEFSIVTQRSAGGFSIPRSALQGDGARRFVYVNDFDIPNAFVKTPVVVGRINDRTVEVLSGLLPADEVVTRGAYSLGFAGAGTLSLKEALDAAHGHEHAADGSELSANPTESDTHNHSEASADGGFFWMIVSGVLFILLVVVGIGKRGARHVE